MLNNKFISIGVMAVIILAVIYLGNMAMRTTPEGGALGKTQYKVVPQWDAADTQGKNIDLLQAKEIQLNKFADEGWELVGLFDNGDGFILKK